MSGWADITFRPIAGDWPGELRRNRRRSQFDTPWGRTLTLLTTELGYLGAKNIVFQIAVDERDIRVDGRPRAKARAEHPGVILAFDSKFGPLKYATDTFDRWEDNVRALALSLEALRKVDRYGVSTRGEQYTGWRALPAGSDDTHGIPDAATAREYLERVYGGDVKRALMETHPDRGGDREEFGKGHADQGVAGRMICICDPELLELDVPDMRCPEHGLVAFLRGLDRRDLCGCGDPADCREAVHA